MQESMGSQRVRHDLATEQQQQQLQKSVMNFQVPIRVFV